MQLQQSFSMLCNEFVWLDRVGRARSCSGRGVESKLQRDGGKVEASVTNGGHAGLNDYGCCFSDSRNIKSHLNLPRYAAL